MALQRRHRVHNLLGKGVGPRECARHPNLPPGTAKRYARVPKPERLQRASVLPAHPGRPSPRPLFAARDGTASNAGNVHRSFHAIATKAGPDAEKWTPREMRHGFFSLPSDHGVPVENVSRLVGQATPR
ncbi:hypothetical protein [Streptosporangium sp. NPDC049644]|uniref:hypothetical protein n=1 Tax=Streptosporangium sp. NPDC049644 TaxID=3155507 RepID=UPI00343E0AC7